MHVCSCSTHVMLKQAVLCMPDAVPPEGKLVALQLAFNLPSSCYATMLVRELTKASTARGVHRALTQVALK